MSSIRSRRDDDAHDDRQRESDVVLPGYYHEALRLRLEKHEVFRLVAIQNDNAIDGGASVELRPNSLSRRRSKTRLFSSISSFLRARELRSRTVCSASRW